MQRELQYPEITVGGIIQALSSQLQQLLLSINLI